LSKCVQSVVEAAKKKFEELGSNSTVPSEPLKNFFFF